MFFEATIYLGDFNREKYLLWYPKLIIINYCLRQFLFKSNIKIQFKPGYRGISIGVSTFLEIITESGL